MTPQTVNAVNLPLQNAMNFPAAILNPPFFDPAADPAQNYGAIGTVIGHEISHSFDDQGAQFDASGRLANWWTKEDMEHFQAAAERLVAQYDAYEPLPGIHLNGKLTLSENIADVAGVSASYDALPELAGRQGRAGRDGFTGDQRFFIGFGQAWRVKARPEALRSPAHDGRPRAGTVPRRHRAQHRRLVRRLRRAPGPEALPRAGGPRPRLVSPPDPRAEDEEKGLPFPGSLCHRCAAPPRYIRTERSVFIRCPILKLYPPQPVRECEAFVPIVNASEAAD